MRTLERWAPALIGIVVLSLGAPVAAGAAATGRADFASEAASAPAREVADWVVASGDNHGLPFAIVDKAAAKVFVFRAAGQMVGATPALLGLARGDLSVPGIGDRKLSTIRPDERTTPAGRFVASMGRNLAAHDILWVDYDAAISLHPVVTSNPKERRLERLASPSVLDNRISYGCINVPANFYARVVAPTFTGADTIVYILPEVLTLAQVFPGVAVGPRGEGRSSVGEDVVGAVGFEPTTR